MDPTELYAELGEIRRDIQTLLFRADLPEGEREHVERVLTRIETVQFRLTELPMLC
jgi:hypothetical protein